MFSSHTFRKHPLHFTLLRSRVSIRSSSLRTSSSASISPAIGAASSSARLRSAWRDRFSRGCCSLGRPRGCGFERFLLWLRLLWRRRCRERPLISGGVSELSSLTSGSSCVSPSGLTMSEGKSSSTERKKRIMEFALFSWPLHVARNNSTPASPQNNDATEMPGLVLCFMLHLQAWTRTWSPTRHAVRKECASKAHSRLVVMD